MAALSFEEKEVDLNETQVIPKSPSPPESKPHHEMKSPLSVTTMHLEIAELNYSSQMDNFGSKTGKALKGAKNRHLTGIHRNKLLFQSQTGQKLRKEMMKDGQPQSMASDVNTVHGSVHNVIRASNNNQNLSNHADFQSGNMPSNT